MAVAKVNIDKHIPLKEVQYSIPKEHRRHMTRVEYEREFRKKFLEYIAKNERDSLEKAGLWGTLIERTLNKGKTPPGWGVHHKLPIHGGGQNEFENMIFIRFSEHFQIHRYIDGLTEGMEDGESRTIKIPYPEGHIYVPRDKQENFSIKKHEESPEERKARIEKNRHEKKREYHERIKN
jgi:hypothetical protein